MQAAPSPIPRIAWAGLLLGTGILSALVGLFAGLWGALIAFALAAITLAALEAGAVVAEPALALVTEAQLFGERALKRRRRTGPSHDPEGQIHATSPSSASARR